MNGHDAWRQVGATSVEITETMQHPEYMHIIARQIQEERRREANEPIAPVASEIVRRVGRSLRRSMGNALVQVGFRLGGNQLRSEPRFGLSPQET